MKNKIKRRVKKVAKWAIAESKEIAQLTREKFKKEPDSHYEIDVSIVIPVYNCEEFIEQTVKSIVTENNCTIEIIAINDESPDDALSILRRLETEVPQLKVFDQSNIGGAPTLNRGLAMAKGKYVGFLDCDDWLAPGALDILFDLAEKSKAQVVAGVVQKYTEGIYEEIHDFRYMEAQEVVTISRGVDTGVLTDSFYTGKLFRRQHLRNHRIRFNPALLYADRPLVTKSILAGRRYAFTPKIVGYWRKHLDGRSITDGFANPKNLIDKMAGFGALLRDPVVTKNPAIHTNLFLEAVKRLFWHYDDTQDPNYSRAFAFSARAIIASYPLFKSAQHKSYSLKQRLILNQIATRDDQYLHEYRNELEAAILAFSGQPVSILAQALQAVPNVGPLAPTLPNFANTKNENMFVFESFFGKSYSGNPRYLFEELAKSGRKFSAVWVYSPKRKPFKISPTSNVHLIQVARGSPQYYQLLQEARYWINNIRFPEIEKPPGTIYIQTWHGTPLKRLGLDIDAVGPEVEGRKSFLADAAKWDYLIGQNDYSAEIFRRAFDVSCPILVEGYPANDVLSSNVKRSGASTFVRAKLGIPLGKKVITYAPTWRDRDQIGDTWQFANEVKMNFERMKEQLGDRYVVVLRLHHLMVKSVSFKGLEGFLFDGSKEPDANRLMAATDILITDYSSIFFDYACSGKPVLFYMHDLDEYASELRGFYLDPHKDLPGPVIETEDQLLSAIANIETVSKEFEKRYSVFTERFLAWDKGTSASAINNRVFSIKNNDEDLEQLRKQRSDMAVIERQKQKIRSFNWVSEETEFDLTVIVPHTAAKKLTEVISQSSSKVQIIATSDNPVTTDLPETITELQLNPKSRKNSLTQILAATKGQFLLFVDHADFRPDTIDILINRAKTHLASLVVPSSSRTGNAQSADISAPEIQSLIGNPALENMVILKSLFERVMRFGIESQNFDAMLAIQCLVHADHIIGSQTLHTSREPGTSITNFSAIDLVNCIHLAGTKSNDLVLALETQIGSPLTASLTGQDGLAEAIEAIEITPFENDLEMRQQISRSTESDPTDPLDEKSFIKLEPFPDTFLFINSSQSNDPKIQILIDYISENYPFAQIIYSGPITLPAKKAYRVRLKAIDLASIEAEYWRARAGWIFVNGNDFTPTLKENENRSQNVVQLASIFNLGHTGWSDVSLCDNEVVRAEQISEWTHITYPEFWPNQPNNDALASGTTKLIDKSGERPDQAKTRQHYRIQKTKKVVGFVRLTDNKTGHYENVFDIEFLRKAIGPSVELVLFDEIKNIMDFVALCDVIVSPPHPVAYYAIAHSIPLIPQNTFLFETHETWTAEAQQFLTHENTIDAVNRVLSGDRNICSLHVESPNTPSKGTKFSDFLEQNFLRAGDKI